MQDMTKNKETDGGCTEKKEYLKVGKYLPEQIEKAYYGQGYIVKDEEAYCDKEHPDRVCYVPELSDTVYTRKSFLEMCRGQEEFADELFHSVDWQHPESLMDELLVNEEWLTCPTCGRLVHNVYEGEEAVCQQCGHKFEEVDKYL